MYKAEHRVTLIKSTLHKTGGLEKYTWQLAQDFCALGATVTILTTGTITPPFTSSLLHIISFPIEHAFSFLQLLHFDRACSHYLAQHPTPIVFSLDRTREQTHIRAGNGVHAAYLQQRSREEGRFRALSFQLNPLHRAILAIEKKAFEDPDLKILFTNSRMVKQEILSHYAVRPDAITVLHNGVEWHTMQVSFDSWPDGRVAALEKYGLTPGAYQFLFIGHNYQRKGLGKLLRALAEIKHASFQLSVIGKDKNSAHFEHSAKEYGLHNKVFFFGPSNDICAFYQMADCLVIPSVYDPFANVTVEALAMGLFVVSSKTNGGSEVISPHSGTIVEAIDDPTCFAQSLQIALSHPKTRESASRIRSQVSHLDFSLQLRRMTERVLAEHTH